MPSVLGFLLAAGLVARADEMGRSGYATMLPRHTTPVDDSGFYGAFIDPTNGYAYFFGNWLYKLDIKGDLPVPVGTAINTGGSSYFDIDPAAGYAYIMRSTLNRYALGAGTNSITAAGTLALNAGPPSAIFVDNSDPQPTNHYAYVFCKTNSHPTRITKIALGTFTELPSYASLNAGETNSGSCLGDAATGYIYFATRAAGDTNARIVKIQMTPGTNVAQRIGSVNLGATEEGIGFGSLDSVHGYAYYGTYGSTNLPSRVYKVKLGESNAAPSLVGHIDLAQGRAQLSLSVLDSVNGFVYFGNDNTFPGGVHQFSLNGTNLPIEVRYLQCLGGPSNNPPDATSAFNYTTNSDGILPYGEVYFRSAVFDPVRGNAYFGQDSRPCQVVKVHLAQLYPVNFQSPQKTNGGGFQCWFTNIMGANFSVLAATNLTLSASNWTSLGSVTDSPPGQYKFTDASATNRAQRFYRISAP